MAVLYESINSLTLKARFSGLVSMGINVTDDNFDLEVIEKSRETPVLVDFWAEWCGPCRVIAPALDHVEKDYQGKFVLAKLDTDHNQKTAGRFKISGIPAVKLFIDGRVVDEFAGALPETHIKQFLDKNLPNSELNEIRALAQEDPEKASDLILEKNISGPIAEDILIKGSIHALQSEDEKTLSAVRAYLDSIPEEGSKYSDARNSLHKFIDSNPHKEELHYMKVLFTPGSEREALEYFLKKVEEDHPSKRNETKDRILTCFFLLGNTNPLVNEYRKKLSLILF
ncbi:MAG: thioredoxin [Spirochaetia bacterium]|nr:thioredoxin [Spirochaetia bacterium]